MTNKLGTQAWIAATIAALGAVLLGYMVAVEGEPGLLPLVLVLGGGAWFYVAWRKRRAAS
jgi:hypothetical protein